MNSSVLAFLQNDDFEPSIAAALTHVATVGCPSESSYVRSLAAPATLPGSAPAARSSEQALRRASRGSRPLCPDALLFT